MDDMRRSHVVESHSKGESAGGTETLWLQNRPRWGGGGGGGGGGSGAPNPENQ